MSWTVIAVFRDPNGIEEVPDGGSRSPPDGERAQAVTVYWPGYSSSERLDELPATVSDCAGAALAVKFRFAWMPDGSPRIVTVTGTFVSCMGSSVVETSAEVERPHCWYAA